MSSEEMEKMIRKYLMFKLDAFQGFIDTICYIFRGFPDKQNEIFEYIKHGAPHRTDRECLEKVCGIVGFTV